MKKQNNLDYLNVLCNSVCNVIVVRRKFNTTAPGFRCSCLAILKLMTLSRVTAMNQEDDSKVTTKLGNIENLLGDSLLLSTGQAP